MSIHYDFTHELLIGGRWAADMEVRAEIEPDLECGGWSIKALHFETIRRVEDKLVKEWQPLFPAVVQLSALSSADAMTALVYRQVEAAILNDKYHRGRIEAALAEENLVSPVDLQTYDKQRVL